MDNFRLKGLRKSLVDQLRQKGIENEAVLNAILQVPRHAFVGTNASAFHEKLYEDVAFPIGSNQTISQPFTVAYQSSLLKVFERCTVLEIGTGSAYQAAILSALGAKVFTVERHKALFQSAQRTIRDLAINRIKCFFGDGFEGLATFAPFDRVLITAAAPYIAEPLKDQLKVGGILVAPLGEGKNQQMIRLTKKENGEFEEELFDTFSFVPMLKGKVH